MAHIKSFLKLLGEPLAITLAIFWLAAAYAVVQRPVESNTADFYTFWDSARWYREGVDPYLGHPLRYGMGYNLNIPAAVLLFLPFSFADLLPAFLAWTTMSVALLVFVGLRIATFLGYRRAALVVSAIFISQTVFSALQLGQLTALLAVLLTEAWIADHQDKPLLAGLLLGIVVGFKPFLGAFVLYALWRRSWRLLAGLAGGVVTVWIAGLVAMGPSGYRSWFEVLQRVTWAAQLSNASILAALQRLLTRLPEMSLEPLIVVPGWVRPLWWVLAAAIVALGVRALARDDHRDRAWLVLITGSLLVSPLGWNYYAPLAAGPLAGYLKHASPRARWIAGVGYVFLCIPYTVMNWPYGKLLSVVVASASTWGVLGLYIAAVMDSPWSTVHGSRSVRGPRSAV